MPYLNNPNMQHVDRNSLDSFIFEAIIFMFNSMLPPTETFGSKSFLAWLILTTNELLLWKQFLLCPWQHWLLGSYQQALITHRSRSEQAPRIGFQPVTKVNTNYCNFLRPPWCNKKVDPEKLVLFGSWKPIREQCS